jgi:hypothetical protein
MLIFYDFHFEIFNEEEDLMFDTKPRLFSKSINIFEVVGN